jgi:hypothetical protein
MTLYMMVRQILSENGSEGRSRRQEVSGHDFSRAEQIAN